jgi:hypothetical protein
MQELKYQFYDKKVITEEDIDHFLEFSYKKDSDENLFDVTEELLGNYESIGESIRNYEIEKVFSPLMVHYNYPRFILRNTILKSKQLALADKIAEQFSIGDVVENYIFEYQEWDMHDIHGYFTCVSPSYELHKSLNGKEPQMIKLDFTTDPNKTSIRKINKKNILKSKQCFQNMDINDFLYIKKMIDLFNDYPIELEYIESLLKIDKITTSQNEDEEKITLTSKQKNKIKQMIEEIKEHKNNKETDDKDTLNLYYNQIMMED